MRIVIATLSILFFFCVIVVSFINYSQKVTVQLWPASPDYTYTTAVSWVMVWSAAAGFVFTGIVAILEGSKTRLANARLRQQVRQLKQELAAAKRGAEDVPARPLEIPEPRFEETDAEETGDPV